jgi:hypothetical protein
VTGNNPDPDAVYFLYTSTGAGHVSYCAWHSYGTCSNGQGAQVAYVPNIDGIAGGDKCAWSFHNDVSIGGQQWKVYMEWSNAAYDAATGYPSTSGQNGCLQGN